MSIAMIDQRATQTEPPTLTPIEKGTNALMRHVNLNPETAPDAIKAAYRKFATIVLDAQ